MFKIHTMSKLKSCILRNCLLICEVYVLSLSVVASAESSTTRPADFGSKDVAELRLMRECLSQLKTDESAKKKATEAIDAGLEVMNQYCPGSLTLNNAMDKLNQLKSRWAQILGPESLNAVKNLSESPRGEFLKDYYQIKHVVRWIGLDPDAQKQLDTFSAEMLQVAEKLPWEVPADAKVLKKTVDDANRSYEKSIARFKGILTPAEVEMLLHETGQSK